MTDQDGLKEAELRLSARYAKEHPWVVQAITGFLSAYFMEHPGFRVRRHFDEPDSGMHVWQCEYPASMTVPRLLKRLQADIPPCRIVTSEGTPQGYLLDSPAAG
ncbi:MAG: hypothetical protein KF814_06560 [Nitrospiraceae bacterium]|nr:hypothetical protein [Nitrospiraceae bacterium]